MQQTRKRVSESANAQAMRGLMIGLAALVVLSVSGYGTVIYIQLMSKVFPTWAVATGLLHGGCGQSRLDGGLVRRQVRVVPTRGA